MLKSTQHVPRIMKAAETDKLRMVGTGIVQKADLVSAKAASPTITPASLMPSTPAISPQLLILSQNVLMLPGTSIKPRSPDVD
jgi:hypothetical protein